MSSTSIATRPTTAEIIEQLVTTGDLSQLKPERRTQYYLALCMSLGLKAELVPFDFIWVRSEGGQKKKLIIYAKKSCAEQLRQIHAISIYQVEERETDELIIVKAYARNAQGREDIDEGSVSIKGLHGDALANARMKAITKAKRRVTLSLCGIGALDETELETIPGARAATSTGWNCLPDTAQLLLQRCDEAQKAGVTLDQMVKLLPEGIRSRQQLSEAQAQLFLNDLEKLQRGQNG